MRRLLFALVLFGLAATSAPAHELSAENVSEARYIGNEAVLVVEGDVKVVFDAFYSDSYGQYVVPDAETRNALLQGEAPYDGIDAVFVSHIHGDHFSPEPMLDFLKRHPDVRVFGPAEILVGLGAVGATADQLKNVTGLDLEPGDAPRTFDVDGVDVAVVAMPHSGGQRMAAVRNLVFRVTVGGRSTVIHFGDTGVDENAFKAQAKHWKSRRVDLAFLPYWFLGNPLAETVLERYLDVDRSVGMHVPEEAAGKGDAWRERLGGDVFTDPGETRPLRSKRPR